MKDYNDYPPVTPKGKSKAPPPKSKKGKSKGKRGRVFGSSSAAADAAKEEA